MLQKDLADKLEFAGKENLNQFIRFQYIQSIDQKWLDHLENMEALREAVYLRSYGQKNPLLEYKLEGFDIFNEMIEEIRRSIATRLFFVRIQAAEERQAMPTRPQVANATHAEAGQFGAAADASSGAASSATARASKPEGATVIRSMPKVGRNDPCPCGSGKKYKHCHGQ